MLARAQFFLERRHWKWCSMPGFAQCSRRRWLGRQAASWAFSPLIGAGRGGQAIGTCVCSICWRRTPASGLNSEFISGRQRKMATRSGSSNSDSMTMAGPSKLRNCHSRKLDLNAFSDKKSSALRSSTHTAESRKAGGQKKSRGSEEGSDLSCPKAVGIALARAFQIVAASSRQMGGRVSISQGHDSQPESAVAAALKRRDVRTDDGAHQLRGSRRSARLLALGRGVTLAYPSASRGVYGSDDNSL